MLRYKSEKLKELNGKWYHNDIIFDGIIYFCNKDYSVKSFIVEKGFIKQAYIPLCLPNGFPLDTQIDCTEFWNLDYDEYSADIPQFYPTEPYHPDGEIYSGISYVFKDDICIYEAFNEKDGKTGNLCYFDDNGIITKFELYNYEINNYFLNKEGSRNCYYLESYHYIQDVSFSYTGNYPISNEKYIDFISIKFDDVLIHDLQISGRILENKKYLNCPVKLFEVFELLNNYKNFKMGQTINLTLKCDNAQELLYHWAINYAFKNTEYIKLWKPIFLTDVGLLKNKTYFPNLKTVKLLLSNKYDLEFIDLEMSLKEIRDKELDFVKELLRDSNLEVTFR